MPVDQSPLDDSHPLWSAPRDHLRQMFELPSDNIPTSKRIVKGGNIVLKLARLAYTGDAEARRFVPMDQGQGLEHRSWTMPDEFSVPVWHHWKPEQIHGRFFYDDCSFFRFRWRDCLTFFQQSYPYLDFNSTRFRFLCW